MSLAKNVAFRLVELFENPNESVLRLAGDTPVLVVGNCCCCCCCHCNLSFSDSDCAGGESGEFQQEFQSAQ